METLIRHLFLIPLFVGALTSCAGNFPTSSGEVLPGPVLAGLGDKKAPLQVKVQTASGTDLSLGAYSDLPLVLVFAQDTCVVCHGETDAILSALKTPTRGPTAIHLVTVLVGADQGIASDWKNGVDNPWTAGASIPWEVAYQADDSLFRSLCPTQKVPCSVIQLPDQGVVFQKTGAAEPEVLKAVTGAWDLP